MREKAAELWRLLRDGDLSQNAPLTRVVIFPLRVLVRAFEEFVNDKCILRASALAYASLLALVPVTAIFFFILTKLDAFSTIQDKVEVFLFRNLLPDTTGAIQEYLIQYSQNVMLLGVFGLIALFVTAIFLFNSVEHTINDIWQAKQRRPFLSKFMAFWTVLTAVPLLMLVSFYLAASLKVADGDILGYKLLPYFLNWMAFWFAYQFIPYTGVRVSAAFTGAIVGGTMWEVAKGAFNWYIANMTSFDKVYGSLGAVPVFLLWLYLTWLIVLFGAEVAYAVQYPRLKSHLTEEGITGFLDLYSVRAMAEIAGRFAAPEENSQSTIDALRGIGIPSEMLGKILNRLSERHLIVYTEDKDYVLARQPSSIMIREVIEAVSGRKMLTPDGATDAVSTRLRKTFQEISADVDSVLDEMHFGMLIEGSEK